MNIGGKEFVMSGHTYVMGILNVTPDSFSDGGHYNQMDAALSHVEEMIQDGADIIDVGGESTRPGHTKITVSEEIHRVVPVIRAIKERFDIPVSIDTYKSEVAEESLAAGADLLNDIWGFLYDEKMAELAAKTGVPVCLMHNRDNTDYKDFRREYLEDMKRCLLVAEKHGVKKDQIILDPGVGFGKNYEHNLLVLKHLDEFVDLGYPVLLGTSRKSVIGLTLDLPANEREEGTQVTTVLAVQSGCQFVRVHNVKGNVRTIRMMEAIKNAE
ncbi:MAG: dihydropteroate synthase [Clostridiales bacterium]|nr:dihydropteroate synthase [Clostridiales bacterium]